MEIPQFDNDTPIGELQAFQSQYDTLYLTHNQGDLAQIRHTCLHLVKLAAKLATYCEQGEHGVDRPTTQLQAEVTPDLLLYSLQFANIFGLSVAEVYRKRLQDNINRLESGPGQTT